MDDTLRAVMEYQNAARALSTHQEAAALAEQTAMQAKTHLAALAPDHPLLNMDPRAIAEALRGFKLHPLNMLVEVLLKPGGGQQPSVDVTPDTALLAASVAVNNTGPGTATVPEILRRLLNLTRDHQHSIEP